MKNITFSAKEELIERAREVASHRKSTLNSLFRDWLADLVRQQDREAKLRELDARLGYANSGGKFTRGEMNER
jgi:predicted transcriptional regulator